MLLALVILFTPFMYIFVINAESDIVAPKKSQSASDMVDYANEFDALFENEEKRRNYNEYISSKKKGRGRRN